MCDEIKSLDLVTQEYVCLRKIQELEKAGDGCFVCFLSDIYALALVCQWNKPRTASGDNPLSESTGWTGQLRNTCWTAETSDASIEFFLITKLILFTVLDLFFLFWAIYLPRNP